MRSIALLSLAALPLIAATQKPAPKPTPSASPTPAASAKPAFDMGVLQLEVVLDRLGFSPGVLDGKQGQSLKSALIGFQTAHGVQPTGALDQPTLAVLKPYQNFPATVAITLTPELLAGPYVAHIPKNEDAQAKLPALAYTSPMEKLAEAFHTTPDTLVALNSAQTKLAPGTKVTFPNVLPTARNYAGDLPDHWRQTLAMLNVDANEPAADKVVVSKSKKVLQVFAGDKLVAQFGVTTGSSHDPLPIGTWKITGFDYNPKFHYNPALFWDAKKSDKKATLPPGPNGPVGVIWMDLTKPHYGIHGTPEPSLIGRTASHGCVRLTNWNVARLSLMIKPGTPAIFEE
jgi:lipoprotein-anchoring transpeptidase ErfK/SrfK